VVYAPTDRVFLSEGVEEMVGHLRGAGRQVEAVTLSGPNGHINGLAAMDQAADRIRAFLAN
jgi:homoserine O-acetyltransferase